MSVPHSLGVTKTFVLLGQKIPYFPKNVFGFKPVVAHLGQLSIIHFDLRPLTLRAN